MINKEQLIDALEGSIDDNIENPDNIRSLEMERIKIDFDRLWNKLEKEAEEDEDD